MATTRNPSSHCYLVVDDAPTIGAMLRSYLEDQGIDSGAIHVAKSGEEGLKLFREHDPDVVFMDIVMPDLDGGQTTQEIFTDDPETKVVVITGHSRQDPESKELLSMGAFAFLEKPIHRSDVEKVLREIHSEDGHGGRIP